MRREITDAEIRIRGVESNKGEKIERGFLQVASWDGSNLSDPKKSGRLELANWMTDERNPLTARVLANRIWRHLTGAGIVRSPDNFGITGRKPTHPELLDFLAKTLIDSNWSTKSVVKEIMLSKVYSMDSEGSQPGAAEIDPDNLLLWKAKRRSLDAETMRDAMLTLAGSLDHEGGGPSLPEGFKSEFGYKFTTQKRSIYVPVFRNSGFEMFNVFDFANPNFTLGKRSESTIPTQALFMTNSPLVHRYANEAASTLLGELPTPDDTQKIILAFRKTLGRYPTEKEQKMALDYLRTSGDSNSADEAEAWAALQRSLFACLDFRFLR